LVEEYKRVFHSPSTRAIDDCKNIPSEFITLVNEKRIDLRDSFMLYPRSVNDNTLLKRLYNLLVSFHHSHKLDILEQKVDGMVSLFIDEHYYEPFHPYIFVGEHLINNRLSLLNIQHFNGIKLSQRSGSASTRDGNKDPEMEICFDFRDAYISIIPMSEMIGASHYVFWRLLVWIVSSMIIFKQEESFGYINSINSISVVASMAETLVK
jgi:hypothetical protein